MNSFEIGKMVKQPKGFKAFVPSPFPPSKKIELPNSLMEKHTDAIHLLGKLDGVTQLLPDKDWFLLMFLRKDAASSSQIEGTRATILDAIEAENAEPRRGLPSDVDDIVHYIAASDYGLKRSEELPFSLRFICELHEILMMDARSTQFPYPGEFRTSQNWIDGTRPDNARFVPPPADEIPRALGDLEKFVHTADGFLPLVKAGLLHAQFETIHPFTDGNGRTGRLLVTMYLWNQRLLSMPILYLSSFFKKHQDVYYERLDGYHSGKVLEWLDFFFEGVCVIADSAITTCIDISILRTGDMQKIQALGKTSAASTMIILENLYKMPVIGIADVIKWTGFTPTGGYKVINRLVEMGILEPMGESDKYAKKWVYKSYLDLFTKDI